jgi:hypothetical protein
MSETAIRTQIYTILSAVTNVGKVYDYERWAANWNTFIDLFKTTISGVDQIRGWEISRRSVGEKQVVITIGSQAHEDDHTYIIRGYMGVSDSAATEKAFNALIESVRTAFRTNKNLNGTCERHGRVQVAVIEARTFGSVLCHYAELSLTVYERI